MAVIRCKGPQPTIDPSVFVAEGACIMGDVEIGAEASIWFHAVLRGDINSIRIGARTNIQDGCVLHVTNTCPVRIGNDVTVGHGAIIHGCTVGDQSLIGMGSVVLDGANIGRNAMVGAGALVPENASVPDGMLAVGVPARIVRPLSEEEREQIRQSAVNYMAYAQLFRP